VDVVHVPELPPDAAKAVRHAEEILTVEELTALLARREKPRGYIGVEPSGLFHIGWCVWVQKLRTLVDLGARMDILLATWHAKINDKLGGDINRIRRCGDYLRHCFAALGVDLRKVRIITAEDLMQRLEYWEDVLRVAKSLTLARIRRSTDIMGRSEEEAVIDFSKLIYPCLQVTDIISQKYEICLSGMDQRRAHVLAREVAEKLKLPWKPVGIHMPLLVGLTGTSRMEAVSGVSVQDLAVATKMSKSKPGDAVFIHDSPKEIEKKLGNAFCPAKVVANNPVLGYVRHLLFSQEGFVLRIKRAEKHGGPLSIDSADKLDALYAEGAIHPLDLKQAAAEAVAEFLRPVREYFEKTPEANRLQQEIEAFKTTR
jgi:tyrosyl-tRNA synthetase